MGQNPPFAIIEPLDGNHYFPVNVVRTDRGISQRPRIEVSFLELRKAVLRYQELKAEGRLSAAEAEAASIIRLCHCMKL